MGPGVENCSTIRGHFNFITCLVDLTKILNHTRRHFPNLEQPPFDRAADIRDTAAVCSWFSTLGRTVESTIIKATACTYFQSLLNAMIFMTACSKKVYDQRRGMLSNMQKCFPLTTPHISLCRFFWVFSLKYVKIYSKMVSERLNSQKGMQRTLVISGEKKTFKLTLRLCWRDQYI